MEFWDIFGHFGIFDNFGIFRHFRIFRNFSHFRIFGKCRRCWRCCNCQRYQKCWNFRRYLRCRKCRKKSKLSQFPRSWICMWLLRGHAGHDQEQLRKSRNALIRKGQDGLLLQGRGAALSSQAVLVCLYVGWWNDHYLIFGLIVLRRLRWYIQWGALFLLRGQAMTHWSYVNVTSQIIKFLSYEGVWLSLEFDISSLRTSHNCCITNVFQHRSIMRLLVVI